MMNIESALTRLQGPTQLSILSISDFILNPVSDPQRSPSKRYSNADKQIQTPASLAADLAHYQELFSKLRFSYVEQLTKEHFLRMVTAQEPEFTSAAENYTYEEDLKEKKTSLKAKKQQVRDLIVALEEQGRLLAGRYEQVQLQTAQLESLPEEIANLKATIEDLRQRQDPKSSDPDTAMPLQPTVDLLNEREQELQSVELEIERLRAALPAKKAEISRLHDELAPIQMRKVKALEEAEEARKRRENGGIADELEEKGRWLRGVETSLKAMLEV